MKRVIAMFAAFVCVLSAAGVLYADGLELPIVVVSEVIKVSGGGKNVKLSPEDWDVKESIKQLFSQSRGEGDLVMLYGQFDDKAWADMKFRSYVESMDMSIVPNGKMTAKPVPKNTIPSAKTGLLNPRNPVKIVTFSNKLHLRRGIFPVRFLDGKGRELGSLKTDVSVGKLEMTLPEGAHDYYVEFCDKVGRTKKYCYVLVNIEPDMVKPAEDPQVTAKIARFEASMKQAQQKMQDFKNRHGITDWEQVTEDDMLTMMKEDLSSVPDKSRQQALSSIEIMQNYMKEHNISSSQNLTKEDEEAIKKLVIKSNISSLPAEYRAAIDRYMKQHKISKYEDLTEKDLQTIGRQLEQQTTKTPKSRKKSR